MRIRARPLIMAGIVATSISLLGSCTANPIILGWDPGDAGVDKSGLVVQSVAGEAGAVECWAARSPGAPRADGGGAGREPEAFVLFFTGKGTRAEQWTGPVAASWGERPVEVWGVNYPGFGKSSGPATLERVGPAALQAYDALASHAAGRPVFVQGASFGTAPALHVAARRPVAGLVLHKPPPLRELVLGSYGWWNLWLFAGPVAAQIPSELDSLQNGRAASAPAVFLVHGADEIIATDYQRQVAESYAGPKRVIDNANASHDAPLTRDASEQMQAALDWLWNAGRQHGPEDARR